MTTASPYEEERTQHSVGLDYLHDRWMMNIGFTNSEENDYTAETFSFGVSQDIFGDLTTVSLGYSLGNDKVSRRGDATFSDDVAAPAVPARPVADPDEEPAARLVVRDDHRRRLPEQSVSPGALRRYRRRRRATATSARCTRARARATQARVRLRYYLPWRAAIHAEYPPVRRHVGHPAPIRSRSATRIRSSRAGRSRASCARTRRRKADFYSDLFPRSQFQNFMARDKELSTFASQTLRLGASYDIVRGGWKFVERGTVNVILDHMMFDYEDFRDLARYGRGARQRAALQLRRQRRPGLRLVLVLTSA